jgi:purine-nucleoside phosphorylase
MRDKARLATQYIQQKTKFKPTIGIILGTGLGKLTSVISKTKVFHYSEIPHFPAATVESHTGKLIFGHLKRKKVVAMRGRFHYYEGYSAKEITLPIMVMKFLGVRHLIISNASGGLNPDFRPSDIMVITDHINLLPDNPLRGKNEARLGPRFPDLYDCYNTGMIKLAEKCALALKTTLKKGVYVAVPGPNLETRAEYRYLRTIGADAVGMSTAPEVLMARYLRIKVLGLSIITDMGLPDALMPANLPKIIKAAMAAEPQLTKIVAGVVARL